MSQNPSNEHEKAAILTEQLAARGRDVWLAFSWSPAESSPIFIQKVRVNGTTVFIDPDSQPDPESPFKLYLGSHATGSKLEIEWQVRAFADLIGIEAHVTAGDQWSPLDETAPLNLGMAWDDSATYVVS